MYLLLFTGCLCVRASLHACSNVGRILLSVAVWHFALWLAKKNTGTTGTKNIPKNFLRKKINSRHLKEYQKTAQKPENPTPKYIGIPTRVTFN